MKTVVKPQLSLGFFLPHALRWLVSGSLLILLGFVVYIGIRFYHVDNQLYLWWRDMRPSHTATLSHASSLPLDRYEMDIDGRIVAGIKNNLSGLAFDNEKEQLIAVINRPATLLTMDREGRVLQQYPIRNASDVEGVAYLGKNHIALIEEKHNRILLTKLPSAGNTELDLKNAMSFSFDMESKDQKRNNAGFEGLGYDQRRDMLYVAKEHSPRALYRIRGLGEYLKTGQIAMRVENLTHWLNHRSIGTDLSSVDVNAVNGHLLLLSDESQRIVELSRSGSVANQVELRKIANSKRGVPQPEGLALGTGGTLYMISEPNLFYRLKAVE